MNKLSEYKRKKISNIATDLLGNKIVFFMGAGFSRELGYPGWGELLKNIVSEHNDSATKIITENSIAIVTRVGVGKLALSDDIKAIRESKKL